MSEFGPSFYGEVLQVRSRAVDDEEDEDDAETTITSSAVLRWSPSVLSQVNEDGEIPCNVLVMAIDAVATGFVQTYFLHRDAELIGVICTGLTEKAVNTFDQKAFTDETCFIYRLKKEPTILFCQCNIKVQPEQAHSLVNQLFSGISHVDTYVAVLSHKSVNDYKSEVPPSQLPVPFLRALKSSQFQGAAMCEYLEQPNVIDGLPAQIMSYCQIKSISAVYYVCYTENMYLDMPSLTEFSALVNTTPFKGIYVPNPNCSTELRKLVEQSNTRNMLYM